MSEAVSPNPSMDFAEGNDPSALATVKQFSPRPRPSQPANVPGEQDTVSIIPLILSGTKVRRQVWLLGDYVFLKDGWLTIHNTTGDSETKRLVGDHLFLAHYDDIAANDWTVYSVPEAPTGSDDGTL